MAVVRGTTNSINIIASVNKEKSLPIIDLLKDKYVPIVVQLETNGNVLMRSSGSSVISFTCFPSRANCKLALLI